MMKFVVLAALVAAATAARPTFNSERIIGGSDVAIADYPFSAALLYNFFGVLTYFSCGGTLITGKTVLSAASCFSGDSAADWTVRLGSVYSESGGIVKGVEQLIEHPDFNYRSQDYDVGLIVLSETVTIADNVDIAQIAGPLYRLPNGEPVTAVGWGTEWAGGPLSLTLKSVEIATVDTEQCQEIYAKLKEDPIYASWPDVTDRMFCAGTTSAEEKGPCQGDVGGPILHNNNVVVGIYSWGNGCGRSDYPSVSTSVAEVVDWILANV